MKLTYNLFASLILKDTAKVKITVLELLEENSLLLKMRFRYKKGGPGCFTRSVVIQPSSSRHLILCGANISDFTPHRFLTCCPQREIQNEISKF